MRRLVSIALFVVTTFWATIAAAQTGSLRVTVTDPSGAVIVGAKVTLIQASKELASVDSGPRGEAFFGVLEPGRYTIRIESAGFEPYEARDVRLRSGENRRDVKLAIARLAETVQVGRDPRE